MYLLMLFLTGTARIEFGQQKEEKKENVEVVKYSARKDSLAEANSKTFQAIQLERLELEKERKRIAEFQERMDLAQQDLESKQQSIQQERMKMEKAVTQSDSLDRKKIRELSKIYGAMRPAEAAHILETLKDDLASKVIKGMNDDRQKARILSALSKDKANRISRILGPGL
jgi:flagellar motility protein MotE (MotC chaperone)